MRCLVIFSALTIYLAAVVHATDAVVPERVQPSDGIVSESPKLDDFSTAFLYSPTTEAVDKIQPEQYLDKLGMRDITNEDDGQNEQDLDTLELQINAAIMSGSHEMSRQPGAGSGVGSGAAPADCAACVASFNAAGGCDAWKAGNDPEHLVPAGCHHCGEEAASHCGVKEDHGAHHVAEVLHHVTTEIVQHLDFGDLSVADFKGMLKQIYEDAYLAGLGLYDAAAGQRLNGTTITSTATPRTSMALLQDNAVPETDFAEANGDGSDVTFHVSAQGKTAGEAAANKAKTLTAGEFASDVQKVNSLHPGQQVAGPDPSKMKVASAEVSVTGGGGQDKSGAASSSPTLIASCIVLLTTLHIFTKSA